MHKYHELNRQFRNLTDEEEREPSRLSALFGSVEPGKGNPWSDVLSGERVVIFAEAGSGKTREMQAHTQRLKAEGKAAFFMPIEALSSIPVREYLTGEGAAWDAWITSGTEEAWIFLDSVDELKLTDGKLDSALRRVAFALGAAKDRAHIFVSCRPSDWRPFQDLETFRNVLPASAPTSFVEPTGDEALMETITKESKNEAEEESQPQPDKVRSVVLLPLGRQQIQSFAEGEGVKDPKAFVSEINRLEAWPFARRPLDLRGLIQVWKDTGTLGTLLKQHESDSMVSLRDDPERTDAGLLSVDEARSGAKRLALAMMMTKTRTIHAPERPATDTDSSSLDPFEALSDWDGAKIRALLRRPIFDPATYGRIRFHHRSIQEYLAAQAIIEMEERGLTKRAIRQLLFADTYGELIVIPSMRPIAAWMSITDRSISNEVLKREPEVLLLHGDPESLPLEARSALINAYVEKYRSGSWRGLDVWVSNVRRLAQPDLAPTVRSAWSQPRTNPEIADFLLQVIWLGAIQACADLAMNALMDEHMHAFGRVVAGRALKACGRTDLLRTAADDILANPERWPHRVVQGTIDELFPRVIGAAELETLIRRNVEPKRTVGGLNWELYNLVDELEPGSDASISLRNLLANLIWDGRTPSEWYRPRTEFFYLTAALAKLTLRELQRTEKADGNLIKAAVIANRYHGTQTVGREEAAALTALIKSDASIREAVFWTEYEVGSGILGNAIPDERGFGILYQSLFGPPVAEDWEWLVRNVSKPSMPSARAVLVNLAVDVWHARGGKPNELEVLKKAVAGEIELIAMVANRTTPKPPNAAQDRFEREMARRDKKIQTSEEQRQTLWREWRDKIVADPGTALSDAKRRTTFWNCINLLQQGRDHAGHLGYTNWRDIRRIFGDEIGAGFEVEAKLYWRITKPPVQSGRKASDRNTIFGTQGAALTGLLIEASQSGWAGRISSSDAARAAEWATCDLNGLPEWFEELIVFHPAEVKRVLNTELGAEIGVPIDEHPHTLSSVRYGSAAVKAFAAPLLISKLATWPRPKVRAEAVRAAAALSSALSIVVESKTGDAAFTELCRNQFLRSPSAIPSTAWLQALAAMDLGVALDTFRMGILKLKPTLRQSRPVEWFAALFGEHSHARSDTDARVLMKFTMLAYEHVRRADDISHEGAYTPGARDEAQSARNRLIGALMNLPGLEAHDSLIELAGEPLFAHMLDRLRMAARNRAAADSEPVALSATDFATWNKRFGYPPRSRDELFSVMCDRLDDIQHDLLHHDFTERDILRPIKYETMLQPPLAKKFEESARGQYQVVREDEVADKKETDIRLLSRGSGDRAVVEIKVGDSWTVRKLADTIRDQLLDLYMRHDTCRAGCLLVTYAGRKTFKRPGSGLKMTFAEVIDYLKSVARGVEDANDGKYLIAVVGLDLRSPLPTDHLSASRK